MINTLSPLSTAASPSAQTTHAAGVFTKRVGYTTYHVGVHFSAVSKETAEDKIARLIRMETQNRKGAGS